MNGHDANGRVSSTGWAGTDGPMRDGRSRLRRRAKRLEAELRSFYAVDTPLAARAVRLAALYGALAESTLLRIGSDPKATRRAATALQAAADRQLAALEVLGAKRNGHGPAPIADLVRAGRDAQ